VPQLFKHLTDKSKISGKGITQQNYSYTGCDDAHWNPHKDLAGKTEEIDNALIIIYNKIPTAFKPIRVKKCSSNSGYLHVRFGNDITFLYEGHKVRCSKEQYISAQIVPTKQPVTNTTVISQLISLKQAEPLRYKIEDDTFILSFGTQNILTISQFSMLNKQNPPREIASLSLNLNSDNPITVSIQIATTKKPFMPCGVYYKIKADKCPVCDGAKSTDVVRWVNALVDIGQETFDEDLHDQASEDYSESDDEDIYEIE
jgi:hypothetical protein